MNEKLRDIIEDILINLIPSTEDINTAMNEYKGDKNNPDSFHEITRKAFSLSTERTYKPRF